MGNEPSALKDDVVARRTGAFLGADKGYKHANRERSALEELDKYRRELQAEGEGKSNKIDKHQAEAEWSKIKEGIGEQFVEKIVKPIEKLTGMGCVQKHSVQDDEEYVYVRQKKPTRTVKDKVNDMVKEAQKQQMRKNQEYFEDSDDDQDV